MKNEVTGRSSSSFSLPSSCSPQSTAAGRLASPRGPRRLRLRGQVRHPGARPDSASQDRGGAGSHTHCTSWLPCPSAACLQPLTLLKSQTTDVPSSSSRQSLGKRVRWGWSCHFLRLHLSMGSHFPTGNRAKMPTSKIPVKTKEDPAYTVDNPALSL